MTLLLPSLFVISIIVTFYIRSSINQKNRNILISSAGEAKLQLKEAESSFSLLEIERDEILDQIIDLRTNLEKEKEKIREEVWGDTIVKKQQVEKQISELESVLKEEKEKVRKEALGNAIIEKQQLDDQILHLKINLEEERNKIKKEVFDDLFIYRERTKELKEEIKELEETRRKIKDETGMQFIQDCIDEGVDLDICRGLIDRIINCCGTQGGYNFGQTSKMEDLALKWLLTRGYISYYEEYSCQKGCLWYYSVNPSKTAKPYTEFYKLHKEYKKYLKNNN